VVNEITEEAGRLVDDMSRETPEAFLSRLSVKVSLSIWTAEPLDMLLMSIDRNADDPDRSTKQIISLLQLATGMLRQGLGKTCTQLSVEQIVSRLIVLGGTVSSSDKAGLIDVMPTLEAGMQLLSAESFLNIVSSLLETDRTEVRLPCRP
jgi:hypothetical protein